MNSDNILLLGLKQSILAISKQDGNIVWKTELPGSLIGDNFVTLLPDQERVYVHTQGKLHCLDLANGQILWTNGLSGCGYGIASLSFPGGTASPDPAEARSHLAAQRRSTS
jgi:outer membrane protein assembly factor BamB